MTSQSAPLAQLKIVIVGHVDHGKSTLIGRLCYDTGSIPDGKYEAIKASCERRGMAFEWAFLMDGLQAERDQNISIETAQTWFRTPSRSCVIIDAPGHKEFLKNMVTGAANADAALMLIDAHEGVQEQTRRHGFLLSLLGIRQVALLVNKMDLVAYRQDAFDGVVAEYRTFLNKLGVTPTAVIPISAVSGDNVVRRSPHMPWYSGPTVTDALETFAVPAADPDLPLRFPVQDVYRLDHRRILAGRVESGTIRVGDTIVFSPRNNISQVRTIECWPDLARDAASAGESIGVTLTEQVFVDRGQIGSHQQDAPIESDCFSATLLWLAKQDLEIGRPVKLRLTTQEVEAHIQSVNRLIDASTLAELAITSDTVIAQNDVAEVTIRTKRPIAFDPSRRIVPTGRFVVIDRQQVCGGGIIVGAASDLRAVPAGLKSQNISWTPAKVSRAVREQRSRQKGTVVWLTGLSGSGKSTIATELERELFSAGVHAYALDGDNLRHGLSADLGFAPEERREHIRRVAEVAKLFADSGTLVIVALISPYREDRHLARALVDEGQFIEVFVSAPLAVCEQRDPKGLYIRARKGEIPEFTGISAPYEPPQRPEIVVDTEHRSVFECVAQIIAELKARSLLA